MFKVSDIKIGYLLSMETERGERYFVTVVPFQASPAAYDLGCCGGTNYSQRFFTLAALDENLILRSSSGINSKVVAIYGRAPLSKSLDNSAESRPIIWVRQEPKKMTVAEIEQKLGYPIEIVSEIKA